jgi:hypothetical protein
VKWSKFQTHNPQVLDTTVKKKNIFQGDMEPGILVPISEGNVLKQIS